MVESLPIVTITGITGFIGSWVGLLSLQSGKYRVRGTVRSTSNIAKLDPLRQAYGELYDNLELVEADLLDPDSLTRAISGSTYVLHVASPFVVEEPRNEDELIRPALDGTRSVLRACAAAKVRRVSLTSSVVSISGCTLADKPELFDESHWSDVNLPNLAAYDKSKTLAERAAWEFVDNLPHSERFELSVINPGFVLGPTMVKTDFASGKVINMFMQNTFPAGIPLLSLGVVDVREVAQAHLNCLERDEAQGKRFICASESLWMREIAEILREHFSQFGYTIPDSEAKYCLIKFAAYFRSDAAKAAQMWNQELNFNNTRSKEILGLQYRSTSDSLKEMVESMMAQGLLEDKRPK